MRKELTSLVVGAGLMALSGAAAAQSYGGFTVFAGVPAHVYVSAPEVHHAPPSYYAQPPVHYDLPPPHREYRERGWRQREHGWSQQEHGDRQARRSFERH